MPSRPGCAFRGPKKDDFGGHFGGHLGGHFGSPLVPFLGVLADRVGDAQTEVLAWTLGFPGGPRWRWGAVQGTPGEHIWPHVMASMMASMMAPYPLLNFLRIL